MKDNELISVILPIYNVEEYLDRCILSIINQTYKNIEIILVNDGSTDGSLEICKKHALRDERIKLFDKKNGGLSDARNYGLDRAIGEFITFVDSDDYVEEDYLEYLYGLIKEYNTKISICSYTAIYSDSIKKTKASNTETRLTAKETLENMLYQKDFDVSAWAKMYEKTLFDDVRFPKDKIFEDALTTYKTIQKVDFVAVGLKSKYNYMIRANSILTGKFSEKKLYLIDAYEIMGNDILKKFPDLQKAVNRSIVYANLSTLRQMINCVHKLQEKEKQIIKYVRNKGKYVLFDKNASKRDKLAIIISFFGKKMFKISWNLYCKKTGRLYG